MLLSDPPTYVSQILYWLRCCDKYHEATCVPPEIPHLPPDQVPDWVIDTLQQCIVAGRSAHRYVALSYVWPESNNASDTLQLGHATLARLQTPGCLSSHQASSALPKVIRDAMELTRHIRERYLWVDRLCIMQNDAATPSQIERMDVIYSGAYLTIIAAASLGLYPDSSDYSTIRDSDSSTRVETSF
ncbi:hypothetical protein AAE478_009729 [Parahypoxylon ruwenzoriense]